MICVGLGDPKTGNKVKISRLGQVITAPIDFSTFYLGEMLLADTAVNVVKPKTNKIFVITAIMLAADKNVSNTAGSIITLYESSDGPATTTETNVIIKDELIRHARTILPGLNIKVGKGNWINAICDDNIVRANVAGYYQTA